VITGELHDIKMLFAGVLKKVEGSESDVVPLLTTSAKAGTWKPGGAFELRMPNPQAMAQNMTEGDGNPIMTACRISGKLKSNFPDGAPEDDVEIEELDEDYMDEEDAEDAEDIEEEEAEEATEHLNESIEETTVIVVADVDILADQLAYQQVFFGTAQVGDNASLLFNIVDFQSGSSDLIAIRSRGQFKRPFTVVDDIEAEAEKDTADKVEATNLKIEQYQERLNELGNAANEENTKLLESEALREREEIQNEIRKAQKELRELNAEKRERIEFLGTILQTINMVLAPAVVLGIAVFLGIRRYGKAKAYAQRRTQE
jgi:hypothetical protein